MFPEIFSNGSKGGYSPLIPPKSVIGYSPLSPPKSATGAATYLHDGLKNLYWYVFHESWDINSKVITVDLNNIMCVIANAKQKHPGCKKVRGQSEAALQIGMCDQKL